MTRDSIWISLRLHRFELLTLALATLAAIGFALWIATSLDALDMPRICLPNPDTGATSPLCDRVQQEFNDLAYGRGSAVSLVLILLPIVAGLILGASVVGREVERGTTRLAWSLTPTRLPWFVARSIPPLLVLAVLSILIGLAADRLAMARHPGLDATASFVENGQRGLVIAGRAVAAYGLAAMAGAVFGRELPGFILALIGLIAVMIGASKLDDTLLRSEAVIRDSELPYQGELYIDQLYRLPDGRLVSWQEAYPGGQAFDGSDQLPTVNLVVPGDRYGFASSRNAGEFALVAAIGLVVAGGAATKRGPGN